MGKGSKRRLAQIEERAVMARWHDTMHQIKKDPFCPFCTKDSTGVEEAKDSAGKPENLWESST
jgi:hypothetical protein